ncbi:MAG TPA: tRNA 2-thiouridine(34) synthase MnmA [bacterium]|nr:tRNA 2-thiouridine(34) synthase MnmA [bacterium]
MAIIEKKKNRRKKVLVAVSGGVDSAVAAKLLIEAGYQVSGIFLNFWKDDSSLHYENIVENKCCSLQAQMDAKKVCLNLGINFFTYNFSKVFKKEVVDNFLDEYAHGRTPNPCVICNKKIKIGGLIEYAKSLGFDYIATGHYSRIEKIIKKNKTIYEMYRGSDKNKDQSYFLYTLNQKQLSHLLLPLGKMKKPKVRQIAKQAGLLVAEKSDSQEICFIPGKHHNDFLKKYLKLKSGVIKLWSSGEIIGKHQGLSLYTIGQRRGIDASGTGPYYAAKFDTKNNILYVVKNFNDPILYHQTMDVKNINWIDEKSLKFPLKAEIVIRYRHKAVTGLINYDQKKNMAHIKFARKQRAVTSGQSAVFYDKNKVLGGGIIV